MKAWIVRDKEESTATIVFNNNPINAQKNGANELDSEYNYVTCDREKEFDKYFGQGFVPVEILVKYHGWWFECFHCYKQVNEETENPIYIKEGVYCSSECQQNRKDEIEKMNSDFEDFQICILQNYTWLDIVKFDGGYPARTASAEFKIPGAKYTGKVFTNGLSGGKHELAYFVSNIDLEIFKEWSKTIRWMV